MSAASGPLSSSASHQRRVLAVLVLVFFALGHSVGMVLFQARGVPASHLGGMLLSYTAGVLAGGLGLTFLEGLLAWQTQGKGSRALRALVLALLLLPPLFVQFTLPLANWRGTLGLNLTLSFLMALSLPLCLTLFFRHVRPGLQAPYFALALCLAYLGGALLAPLLGGDSPDSSLSDSPLAFLNLTRNLLGLGVGVLCWLLLCKDAEQDAAARAGQKLRNPGRATAPARKQGRFSPRPFSLLLLPFLTCFFLSGFEGNLFFPHVVGRGPHLEYMYLFLSLLLPLLGVLLALRGWRVLPPLIGGATLCFAFFWLLGFLPLRSETLWAAVLICAVLLHVLLYLGTLACMRHAALSRAPALVVTAVWLAAVAVMPGRFFSAKLLPALDLPVFPAACLSAASCAATVFALRRSLPLPCPSSQGQDHAGAAPGPSASSCPETRLLAFAATYNLRGRETEVLRGISQGQDMAAIAEGIGISERTGRHHMTGVLRKTGLPDRKGLELFFSAWEALDDHSEEDAPPHNNSPPSPGEIHV